MKGAVTDGVSKLKLKLEVVKNFDKFENQPVLEIVNSDAEKNETATGSLGEGVKEIRRLDMDLKTGSGKTRAIYTAPAKFVRIETDKISPERYIQLKVNSSSEGLPKIILKRPPVNLVHGVWADETSWNNFEEIFNNNKQYDVFRTDYRGNNAGSFKSNVENVKIMIDSKLKETLASGFAASKVNYIGHSMGGLLLKEYCLAYGNCVNTINKYVSIDSPHKGSELANLVINVNATREAKCLSVLDDIATYGDKEVWVKDSNKKIIVGGLDDLAVGSKALRLQQDFKQEFPWQAIVGVAEDGEFGHSREYKMLWSFINSRCYLSPDSSFSTWFGYVKPLFNGKNDRIVSISSQAGSSLNVVTVDKVDHSTVLKNEKTIDFVKKFIEE
jgi:pimeloyl-ACP methyl ester carboxylesterase